MLTKDQVASLTAVLGVGTITAAGFAIEGTIGPHALVALGLNLASTIIHDGASKLKDQWLSTAEGFPNHDLQQALLRAYLNALAQLEDDYLRLLSGNTLQEFERESKEAIRAAFDDLSKVAQQGDFSSIQEASRQKDLRECLHGQPEIVYADLWNRIEKDRVLHTYSEHFRSFVRNRLFKTIQLFFAKELRKDNRESNRAWRAFQQLLLEGIYSEVKAARGAQDLIQKDLAKLQDVKEQMNRLENSLDHRDPDGPFEHALEMAIDALRSELVAGFASIEKGVSKIDATTLNTSDAVHRTEAKIDDAISQMRSIQTRLEVDPRNHGFLLDEEFVDGATAFEDELDELLERICADLPRDMRIELYRQVLRTAWQTIVYQPLVATRIYKSIEKLDGIVIPIIRPLCKAALGIPMNAPEAVALLAQTEDSAYNEIDDLKYLHRLLAARFIRYLFYTQSEVLGSTSVVALLSALANRADPFYEHFFTDAHYRLVCQYYVLSDKVSSILVSASERNREKNPDKPLSLVWPFVSNPLRVQHEVDWDTLLQQIKTLARRCEETLELRWCVLSLMRVMPLYSFSEEDLDYSEVIASIIEEFPRSLAFRSSQLLFLYLNSLLRTFIRRKQPDYLTKYENLFTQMRGILPQPCAAHLQLEYASTLYIAAQFLNIQDIAHLRFFASISSGISPEKTALLSNPFVSHLSQRVPLTVQDKGTIFRWLSEYITTMFRVYAQRVITENHLQALTLKASTQIYHIFPLIAKSALKSLQRSIEMIPPPTPSFCAKSSDIFDLLPRNQNMELMLKYVERALNADQYNLVRSAKGIAKSLYSAFYYGDPSLHDKVKQWAVVLADATTVGVGVPKQHWAYYAGIMYESRQIEQTFVAELSDELEQITRKIHQLKLRREETVSIVFSSDVVRIIVSYDSQGSLFAKTLRSDLSSPETWNLLATTVFNCRVDEDSAALMQAACGYSLAKCMARSLKVHDQKYCYNFIRCRSLEQLVTPSIPVEFFFRDVAAYLTLRASALFSYKTECVEPYLRLLLRDWGKLPDETKQRIIDDISQVTWLRNESKKGKRFAEFGFLLHP
jgi:hypothetical protein